MGLKEKLSGLRQRYSEFQEQQKLKSIEKEAERHRKNLEELAKLREEEKRLDLQSKVKRTRERVSKKKFESSTLYEIGKAVGFIEEKPKKQRKKQKNKIKKKTTKKKTKRKTRKKEDEIFYF